MIINMQLSSVLSRAKIDLRLNWRPSLKFEDLPLDVVDKLWRTKSAFDEARSAPSVVGKTATTSRKFDKSPW